jgi:hypothetical protein
MPYDTDAPSSEREPASVKPEADEHEHDGVWWLPEARGERHPHEILKNVVRQVVDDQESRYSAYKEYRKLFGSNSDDEFSYMLGEDLEQNELRNTIETLWAQVFKNKVVPAVATSEADYEEWARAKAYGRWLEGALDESKAHREVARAGLDMFLYGTGCVRVFSEEDWDDDDVRRIRCERISPRYLYTDKLESRHGKPRSLHQKHHIDKWVLLALYKSGDGLYGDKAERCHAIRKCTSNDDEDLAVTNVARCDMVTVWESWHLPSSPKAKDGRHVVWIDNCTLLDEEWDWECFPFMFMRFGTPDEGFWGESAVSRLAGLQKVLDKLNKKIDESQDVMGVPRILVRRGAHIVKSHIDDIPGGILECDDLNGIKDWNAQCVTPELYQERDMAPRKMRSLLGVSDFEVQQQIPQGMRDVSGAMLERWVDQGQARHAMTHSEYENVIVELSYLYMRTAADCQEDEKDVVVTSPGEMKTTIEVLSFKEVCVDRKRMKLIVQPMSQLPQTFAGKIDAIVKMSQDAQLPITAQTKMRMLQVPDLNAQNDLSASDEEIIMKNLHFMVKEGKYLPPLQYDNLEMIVMLTTKFINSYRVRKDAKMERVALLAQYIEDALNLKNGLGGPDPNAPPPPIDPMAAAAGQMGAPPIDPMGAGAMPPAPGVPPAGPMMDPAAMDPAMMGMPGPV